MWGLSSAGEIKQIEKATEVVTDIAGDESYDITIGPDGSVFIVTTLGVIKRKNVDQWDDVLAIYDDAPTNLSRLDIDHFG